MDDPHTIILKIGRFHSHLKTHILALIVLYEYPWSL